MLRPWIIVLFMLNSLPIALGQNVIFGSFSWPDRGVRWEQDANAIDPVSSVRALTPHSDGRLYVGGNFNYAGEIYTPDLAVWDGASWSSIGATEIDNTTVHAIVSVGSDLYVAGSFSTINGMTLNHIGRWDGETWLPLGTGTNGGVACMAPATEESKSVLYVGGGFFLAGGVSALNIARWDGVSWSSLGSGCNGGVGAIAFFDDGNGPALYATGGFSEAGGVPCKRIAKWDGVTWSPLGQGILNGNGRSLAVFDDGSGPALYVGGDFHQEDGNAGSFVQRWDGEAWSDVGELQGEPQPLWNLKVLDDGSGPALYAVGVGYIVQRWDGTRWTRYDPVPFAVLDIAFFDSGHGPQLHVGGGLSDFHTKIARFTPGFACGDFNGDGVVDQADLGILLAAYDNCPGPGCDGDTDGDGDVDQSDLGTLLAHFGQQCG